MKSYDVICPNCGHVNQNLYLDETNGWMECEECGMTHRVSLKDRRKGCVSLPVIMEGSTRIGVAFERVLQGA